MARELLTTDGRYLLADQDDGNAVVYDLRRPEAQRAVWDRWSYEAALGNPPAPHPPAPPVPPSEPSPPAPLPGARRSYRVTTDHAFVNRGYSYWASAFIQDSIGAAFVFAGHQDGRPRFFKVDLRSGQVTALGALVGYGGTTEGWYWDAAGGLYIVDGPRLRRLNPFDQADDRVVLDISGSFPNCRLWQCHSSDDGQVHSGTVERITSSGPYQRIGTIVARAGHPDRFYDARQSLDESQVSRDGRFVLIKEGSGPDNRIIDVTDSRERVITNAAGALGHSDMGHGFAVGEDDQRGACVWINLHNPDERRVLFETWNMGHVSVRGDRVLASKAEARRLDVIRIADGAVLASLDVAGWGGDYDNQVRASLDPSGRLASYVAQGDVHLWRF